MMASATGSRSISSFEHNGYLFSISDYLRSWAKIMMALSIKGVFGVFKEAPVSKHAGLLVLEEMPVTVNLIQIL